MGTRRGDVSFDSPVDGITNSIGISSWPQINQQLSEGPTEGKRRRGHGHSAQVEDHSLWTEGEREMRKRKKNLVLIVGLKRQINFEGVSREYREKKKRGDP